MVVEGVSGGGWAFWFTVLNIAKKTLRTVGLWNIPGEYAYQTIVGDQSAHVWERVERMAKCAWKAQGSLKIGYKNGVERVANAV